MRRVSAAAVFAAATLNASPLYRAVLSEQTASDTAWLAVAETLAARLPVRVTSPQVTDDAGRIMDVSDDMVLLNIWHAGEGDLQAGQTWTVMFSAVPEEACACHPADLNCDWKIEIPEAVAYLAGWQQGRNPMAYAIRAAYLWQKGPCYTCLSGVEEPMCWEPIRCEE